MKISHKKNTVLGLIILIMNFHVSADDLNTTRHTITTPPPISGRAATAVEDILPADVLARVKLVQDELELIRYELGKPKNIQPELNVTDAAPREVYYQALTMFQKANRLAFEHTGITNKSPITPPVDSIRPAHVWHNANQVLKRVLLVKESIGVTKESQEKIQDEATTPTDVFRLCIQVNRQLNLLLEQRFSPSDVFQQVTLATNYSARLIAKFPNVTRRPEAAQFEHGKTPADVYRRLQSIYQNVRKLALFSQLKMLNFQLDKHAINKITPSDVYDVASLLVSELSYIHSKLDGSQPPEKVYYPGKKFPAHVYQRAGILNSQIDSLLVKVAQNPNWLSQNSNLNQ